MERPAILGGPAAVTLDQTDANRWPVITSEDESTVLDVLRSGELSTHPVTRELEQDYREYFGVRHALAHCNGTAALLAAFFGVGLRPGDEVIVPSATWWASVVPMTWLGAVPVFAESEPDRCGLDPDDVRRRITPRTRAIVVVHLWGMPSRMTELLALAGEHKLAMIEDASHAHGATWRGRKCGTLGDVSVFSLQGHKLAPAGEGGMLLSDRDVVIERATMLGDVHRTLELQTPNRRFAATTFGMKTRMAPLSAAVARVQLRRLDERNARRNANVEYISEQLEPLGIHTFRLPPHVTRVYFEFLVRPDERRTRLPTELLVKALKAEGCRVERPRYPLLHQQPFFTEGTCRDVLRLPPDVPPPVYAPNALPRTEAMNRILIKLPAFPNATRALLDQYALAFRKVIEAGAQISRSMQEAAT